MSVHTATRRQGIEIVFMWVPAHVGILGNDRYLYQTIKNRGEEHCMEGKQYEVATAMGSGGKRKASICHTK